MVIEKTIRLTRDELITLVERKHNVTVDKETVSLSHVGFKANYN